jgi:hypothetical protein
VSPRSKFSSGLGTASALVAAICTGLCHSRCHSQARFRLPKDSRGLTDLGAELGPPRSIGCSPSLLWQQDPDGPGVFHARPTHAPLTYG